MIALAEVRPDVEIAPCPHVAESFRLASRLRDEEGLSYTRLSERTGVPRSTLCDWLTGRVRPTCRDCMKLRMSEQQIVWTRERVADAIRRWADEHGAPPLSTGVRPRGRGFRG